MLSLSKVRQDEIKDFKVLIIALDGMIENQLCISIDNVACFWYTT